MYRGEAYLHQDRINSVLKTAETLKVKGLYEGPKTIDDPVKNAIAPSPAAGGGSGNGGPSASNAHRWSSPPHEPSPVRSSTVGIMGYRSNMKREHHHRDPPVAARNSSDLHSRDLDGSPPPQHFARNFKNERDSQHRSLSPHPPADHGNFAYPHYSGLYSNSLRGLQYNNRDYSPSSTRDRSPPDRVRSYGSASTLPVTKEEREELFNRHERDALDKRSDRHTPASYHGDRPREGDRDRDPERGSSRNSPPSPSATPNSLGRTTPASERAFPSDSTTDFSRQVASSSSNFKDRIRRTSESAAPVEAESGPSTTERSRTYEQDLRSQNLKRTTGNYRFSSQ